jgi:hypothetical protein
VKITRIDRERRVGRECNKIHIEFNGAKYEIKEEHGQLMIQKNSFDDSSTIKIEPHMSNVIYIK